MLRTNFSRLFQPGFSRAQRHPLVEAAARFQRIASTSDARVDASPFAPLRGAAAPLSLALLAALGVAAVPSHAGSQPVAAKGQAEKPSGQLEFTTRIEGRKIPDELRTLLEDAVTLGKGKAPPPPTLGQLRRRATDDADRMIQVLRSEGYYNGTAEPVIQEAAGGRFDVVYRVALGPRTMIRSFVITYPDHPSDEALLPHDGAALGLKPGRAARAQRVIDLTNAALTHLENRGHPRPKLAERKVVVDLAANEADVTLAIEAGEPRRFGEIEIENKGRTKPDYVRSLAKFKPGDAYDRGKADETVAALRKTGLFDQVSLESEEAEGDTVPQKLTLSERAHRSVGVGATWSSNEGPGVRSFWEHRNVLGAGEKLHLDLNIAEIEQLAGAHFNKPHFLRDDQNLLADFEIAHEDTDAYRENRVKAAIGLARKLRPNLDASAGVSFEIERTDDSTGYHAYELFGLPLTMRYDGSNNLLDPTEGTRLTLALTPYAGRSGTPVTFTKIETTGTAYWSFGTRPDLTLAVRGRYGTMLAQKTLDVPGSVRFYAGGGGSIRGYAYQLVGPLDANNKPLGARSVFEASTEARYRITRDIGIVAFLDGGNAYSTLTPKFNQQLQWGAGLGLRYYTPIGPIRADVGVPLNRRHGIDDAFQVYFSLGQAF